MHLPQRGNSRCRGVPSTPPLAPRHSQRQGAIEGLGDDEAVPGVAGEGTEAVHDVKVTSKSKGYAFRVSVNDLFPLAACVASNGEIARSPRPSASKGVPSHRDGQARERLDG